MRHYQQDRAYDNDVEQHHTSGPGDDEHRSVREQNLSSL